MPNIGYKQSAAHKRKRLSRIEGKGNGRWIDGRRIYRKLAGAKRNDGTVVHHLDGKRHNNRPSNLEKLSDGERRPGRRTTPHHEKITPRGFRRRWNRR